MIIKAIVYAKVYKNNLCEEIVHVLLDCLNKIIFWNEINIIDTTIA